MTKGIGQKHYRPEDYEHAAHQADAAYRDGQDAARKAKLIEKGVLCREATRSTHIPSARRKGKKIPAT